MAFAQLTYRESLRDIEVCLAAQAGPKQAPPQMRPMAKSQRNLDTIRPSVTGVRSCTARGFVEKRRPQSAIRVAISWFFEINLA